VHLATKKKNKMTLRDRMQTLLDKTAVPLMGAVVLGTLFAWAYNSREMPDAVNFPQPNAEVVSYKIDTPGKVLRIDRNRSIIEDSTSLWRGRTRYEGQLFYEIEPQVHLTPPVEDGQEYSAQERIDAMDPSFWTDLRKGTVTVRREEE